MGEHKKRKQCSAIERHHGQVHVPAEEAPSSENEGLLMQRREQFIQILKVAGLEERRRDKKQRKRTRALVGTVFTAAGSKLPAQGHIGSYFEKMW